MSNLFCHSCRKSFAGTTRLRAQAPRRVRWCNGLRFSLRPPPRLERRGRLQIVAESHSGEMPVSAVARRHGLSPGQLFTWRRQSRSQPEPTSPPMFVPAVIDTTAKMHSRRRRTITKSTPPTVAIELEI
ncbi:transposase [Rhizobium leguminosarum]|uniref:transposase n=1 Tax=Rhizobium leguminosarum TaxID=384 RepID=UPI003D7A9817